VGQSLRLERGQLTVNFRTSEELAVTLYGLAQILAAALVTRKEMIVTLLVYRIHPNVICTDGLLRLCFSCESGKVSLDKTSEHPKVSSDLMNCANSSELAYEVNQRTSSVSVPKYQERTWSTENISKELDDTSGLVYP
jgi:hypothetical protein